MPDVEIPDEPWPNHIMGNCDAHGDKIAFADATDGRSVSFNQLKTQVMQVAAALMERGFKKDDIMVTNATNCIE